jgi:hypothetical protein
VALARGTHRFGPADGSLEVRTYREGMAARVGHDLVIDVARWDATVEVADDPGAWTVALNADPDSLHVREGVGGVKPLSDKDRRDILENVDDRLLGHPIRFRSSDVQLVDGARGVVVEGELSMAGATRPLTARLSADGAGAIGGTVALKQSDWGLRPFRGLMGALKVCDEIEVVITATASPPRRAP